MRQPEENLILGAKMYWIQVVKESRRIVCMKSAARLSCFGVRGE